MNFKAQLERDVENVFLNPHEFAEEININGHCILAIVDDSSSDFRGGAANGFGDAAGLGLLQRERMVFCRAAALEPHPLPEQRVMLDGQPWLVSQVGVEAGMLRMTLIRVYA